MPFLGEGKDATGIGLLIIDWEKKEKEYVGMDGCSGANLAEQAQELILAARQAQAAGKDVDYLFYYGEQSQLAAHDAEGFYERYSPWSAFFRDGKCPGCGQPIPVDAEVDGPCRSEECLVYFRVPGEGDGAGMAFSHKEALELLENFAWPPLTREQLLELLTLSDDAKSERTDDQLRAEVAWLVADGSVDEHPVPGGTLCPRPATTAAKPASS